MEHQSLYRRYRPACFGELIGQHHVVTALRNSVRDNKVGHAYLFSGPRGTGKTSTARILAKAINCENLTDGEPCGTCQSCLAFAAGTSYDLHELDAASNNKVEDIRDLISKVSFGTPGRRKVYVLDEVHMLTTGAENALLKTLEEPPAHVCFVMCTTEPHKVAATVRSRAQHLQFELVTADELAEHVRWVAEDAKLSLSEDDLDYAVRAGNGSVRDTLSALDQVVSAEGKPQDDDLIEEFVAALATWDPGVMVSAADTAIRSGKEPRVIAEEIVRALRSAFLCSVGADLSHLLPQEQAQAQARAEQLPTVAITKTFEELGQALVHMRQSPDPRIDLELAFFRLTRRDAAGSAAPAGSSEGSSPAERPSPAEMPSPARGDNRSASDDRSVSRQSSEQPRTEAQTKSAASHSQPDSHSEQVEPPTSNPNLETPVPRNFDRVQRATAQLREELQSAAPRSTFSSSNNPPAAQPAAPQETTSPNIDAAAANPAPTLGAIRKRRAAEQSRVTQSEAQAETESVSEQDIPEEQIAPAEQDTPEEMEYLEPQSSAPESYESLPPSGTPSKSTAEAVGISEETMARVKEYFPDARAVEIPESVKQKSTSHTAPQTSKQHSPQQSVAPSPTDNANHSPTDPSSTDSTDPSSTDSNQLSGADDLPKADGTPVIPSRDEITVAWGNEIFDNLSLSTKRRFSVSRFLTSQDDAVRLALPAASVRSVAPEQHQEIEAKLAEYFNCQIAVHLLEDDGSAPTPPDPEMLISKDIADTATQSVEEKLREALSHDATVALEAQDIEAREAQENNPNIPQDSLFG